MRELIRKIVEKLGEMFRRRDFRRDSKGMARVLGTTAKISGMPLDVSSRMNVLKTAFRAVAKKPVRDIPTYFADKFERKEGIQLIYSGEPRVIKQDIFDLTDATRAGIGGFKPVVYRRSVGR